MHYVEEIRDRLYSTNGINPVRVAIYARVSTDNESQKDSCANQVYMARTFLASCNAIIIDEFVDDGISGKNDINRPQYQRMASMIQSGKIDLIVTKALSRLNRDQMNAIALDYLLFQYHASIFTLEDNQLIDLEDDQGEILRGLIHAINAHYVRKQSLSGRRTQDLRCQKKELSAKDISFGYRWDKESKTIYIDDEEAAIVKEIFEEYVFRGGIPAEIQRKLEAKYNLIRNKHTIIHILSDERYIGKFYINKTTTTLGRGKTTSKKLKRPREEWVLVNRPDLQLVDEDIFEMAQRLRQSKKSTYLLPEKENTQSYFQGVHLFAGKVFCSSCGKSLQYCKEGRHQRIALYRVRRHGQCSAPTGRVTESDLETITRMTLRSILKQQKDVCSSLEQILEECVRESYTKSDQVDSLVKQINTKEKQIEALVENLSDPDMSEVTKQRIKAKIKEKETTLQELEGQAKELKSLRLDPTYVSKKMQRIRASIIELSYFKKITREMIKNYVERYVAHPNGDIDIILRTGQSIAYIPQLKHIGYSSAVKMVSEDALTRNRITMAAAKNISTPCAISFCPAGVLVLTTLTIAHPIRNNQPYTGRRISSRSPRIFHREMAGALSFDPDPSDSSSFFDRMSS